MSVSGYINAAEFIETLRSQGLVLVPLADFELNKSLKRRRAMKKQAVTVKEIVDLEMLPLQSKKGVFDWIENGRIHPDEVVKGSGKNNAVKILTSAIMRLGYGE